MTTSENGTGDMAIDSVCHQQRGSGGGDERCNVIRIKDAANAT